MAGDWIKMRCNLWDDPRVLKLVDVTDTSEATVIGGLFWVWSAADQHSEDGVLFGMSIRQIDRRTGIPGFGAALEAIGWIASTEDGVSLARFDEHNGASAKKRSETARRVSQHRSRAASEDRSPIPAALRKKVLAASDNCCVYCGRKDGVLLPMESRHCAPLHVDHVIPLSRGGAHSFENMAAACQGCNNFKADRTPDECGFDWPVRDGKRIGNEKALQEEYLEKEKEKEKEKEVKAKATGQQADHDADGGLPEDIAQPDGPDVPVDPKPPRAAPRKAQTAKHFPAFWAAYPVKKGKAAAEKHWKAKGCDVIADDIVKHVRMMEEQDDQWRRGFIPHGSTYVCGEHWTDEPAKDKDVVHITTPAPAADTFGAAAVAKRSNTETPLERALAYIRHQRSLGAYGEGEDGDTVMREKMTEARAKHGGAQ